MGFPPVKAPKASGVAVAPVVTLLTLELTLESPLAGLPVSLTSA